MTRANRLFVQEVQRELIPESDETRVLISCHAALDTVTARTCRMQRPHSALYLCDVTPRPQAAWWYVLRSVVLVTF